MRLAFSNGEIDDEADPRNGKRVIQLHVTLGRSPQHWRDIFRVGPLYLTVYA